MARKKPYQKKSFESTGAASDTSANIYMSMRLSAAWKELTAKQRDLYSCCKAQYYAEKRKPNDNQLAFTMNQAKWCDLYALYTVSNHRMFYRDMSALIEKGFIVCVECGKATRTKSIYAFSDKWQWYGTDAFEILPSEMTSSMRRRCAEKGT